MVWYHRKIFVKFLLLQYYLWITYPSFSRSVNEEDADVDSLKDTANCVDGDEEESVGFEQCVIDP